MNALQETGVAKLAESKLQENTRKLQVSFMLACCRKAHCQNMQEKISIKKIQYIFVNKFSSNLAGY